MARALFRAAAAILLDVGPAAAAEKTVRIGVVNDQSSIYADMGGPGSVAVARLAVEDSGLKAKGRNVEILVADHGNKADVASTIVRQWFDTGGVDAVADVTNSAAALAVSQIVRDIDCSTTAVAEARALHAAGLERGIAVLDAPVSGGVMGAEAGTLTFMVGGEAADLDRARPVLEAMGRNVFHAGAAGNGQAAKICNNLLAGIAMIAVSEAYTLAKRLGLDAATMRDIVSTATGNCHALVSYPPVPGLLPNVPSSRGYRNGFAAALMLKDLRLAERAAMETGSSLPLGTLAASLYGLLCGGGDGELDYSGVIRMIEGGDAPAASR